ncbi:MAG: helix-turn-helix domain-containing protein, partial [Streptomycetaceae bacterium]|nr:helix-turn-helix domain-containing protein [Streptomycetaceae bacterium]
MKRGTARTPNPLLRAARVAAGFTQQELADLVGVTRGTIANAENGASAPRGMVVDKLAETLHSTPDALGLIAPNEHPMARIRRESGRTQDQLAQQCGVTRRTIIDLEAGRGDPKPVLLGKLVEALGAEPAALGFAPANTHPLTAARTAHGLTQQELAARVGVHTNVVINAESGRRPPRPGTVLNLADFFQTTPQTLGFPKPGDTWRVAARKSDMQYWVPLDGLLIRIPPPKQIPRVRELPEPPGHLAGLGTQAAYLHAALAGFPYGVRAGARDAARAELPWSAPQSAAGDTEPIVRPDPDRAPHPGSKAGEHRKSLGKQGASLGRRRPGKATGRPSTPEQWLRPLPGAAALSESVEALRRRTLPRGPAERPAARPVASGGAREVFHERFALALQSGYLRGWTLMMARRALDTAVRNPQLAASGVDTARCAAASAALDRELPDSTRESVTRAAATLPSG